MEIPAFKRISASFKIEQNKYQGMVVVSPDALYFVMVKKMDTATMGAVIGASFGLVGALVVGAIASALPKKEEEEEEEPIRTCTVAELGADIRHHTDWPYKFKPKDEDKQVLIVNKQAVELVEHPRFGNILKIKAGDTLFRLEYLFFKGKSIRDYLTETGWPMNWAGELVNAR